MKRTDDPKSKKKKVSILVGFIALLIAIGVYAGYDSIVLEPPSSEDIVIEDDTDEDSETVEETEETVESIDSESELPDPPGFEDVALPGEPTEVPIDEYAIETIPFSGKYSFSMNPISTSCITGGAISSTGDAIIHFSASGHQAVLSIDGQYYPHNGLYIDDVYNYYSQWFNFPTKNKEDGSATGKIRTEIFALGEESVGGKMYWENSVDCSGINAMNFEWVEPADFDQYLPQEGDWEFEFEPAEHQCEEAGGPISMEDYDDFPIGEVDVTVDYDLDTGDASMYLGDESTQLHQAPGSNIYGPDSALPNTYEGPGYYDSEIGEVNFDDTVDVYFDGVLTSPTTMTGSVTGSHSSGCSLSGSYTATYVGGPSS